MTLLKLSFKSLSGRKVVSTLCILSIALSVALFLGIERIRTGAKEGFMNTISQTDLIVGAKGGSLQLLLYTVFQLGQAISNIRYSSYKEIAGMDSVEWSIPISLGDSYRGFRVVGTTDDLFKNYRFRGDQQIHFLKGETFKNVFEVVIGSDLFYKLKLNIGDEIFLSHGLSEEGGETIAEHKERAFKVVGIMAPTQTPLDRGVYIALQGLEAIHFGLETGSKNKATKINYDIPMQKIKITQITSMLIKAKSRFMTLRLQRQINDYLGEPLMGVIPGLALSELWQILSYVEESLLLIGASVLVVGIFGITISLYSSLNERRREISILRSLGISLGKIIFLFVFESLLMVVLGVILGMGLLTSALHFLAPMIQRHFSIYLESNTPTEMEYYYLIGVLGAGVLSGLIPAIRAYFNSLQDGLAIKN